MNEMLVMIVSIVMTVINIVNRCLFQRARTALTSREFLSSICGIFDCLPNEQGGILGFGDSPVFVKDPSPLDSSFCEYVPNTDYLNGIVSEWRQAGIAFCGFVHTHPNGEKALSQQDIDYAREILPHFDLDVIFMYVVTFDENMRSVFCYSVGRKSVESIRSFSLNE